MKKQRKALHTYVEGKDIKYRGPLSYRHLRIIGWSLFAVGQIGVLLSIVTFLKPDLSGPALRTWENIFKQMQSLLLPLLLMATFSIILNAKDGYKKLFITYAIGAFLVFLAFLYLYEHYIIGILTKLMESREDAANAINGVLNMLSNGNFLTFNIFVDLLLCTSLTFFINYHPNRYFIGKKLIIFRLFAIFPILYEIASFVLKLLSSLQIIELNPYFYPFLTTKSPLLFIAFIILVFFIKNREKFFVKRGGNIKDYPKFLQSNANSLHFSIASTITFVSISIIDIILSLILAIVIASNISSGGEVSDQLAIMQANNQLFAMGLGQTPSLLIVSPIFLLFSYTRRHKNRIIDTIIPIAGIALAVFVYIEGFYWIIVNM